MPLSAQLERMFERRAQAGTPRLVLEKDYGLSYLLAGIAAVPRLYAVALFKGGTSLRKAYFPDYRFSEDLDYTLQSSLSCDELLALLTEAAERAAELLHERGDFALDVRAVPHRQGHERSQCEFKVDVRFPWMKRPSCALKVEMLPAPPEIIAGTPQERELLHGFSESLSAKMRCYPLEEIAAEKLRGFLQTRKRFDELAAGTRGFALSRARDLFDLAHLQAQTIHTLDRPAVRTFLAKKVDAYGLTFSGPSDFLDPRVLEHMRANWEASLRDFVPELPPFEQCLEGHTALLDEIFPRRNHDRAR